MRILFFLCFLISVTTQAFCADDNKAQPATLPVAMPAFVDVVSFEFRTEDENHQVVVTSAPYLLRVDEIDDGYSVIYNAQTDFYTGLENRNYTYWEFSWPQIRDSVESSKRAEARLQELNSEGFNGDTSPPTTQATDASVSATSSNTDDSGYVWHPTTDRKRISGLDCIRWIGDTLSGENVEAWCCAGLLPKVKTAVDHLRVIDGPMALVPVRTIVPDFIFPVYDALTRGGVTPILITWGDQANKSSFRLVETKTRDGRLSLFTVPKLYIKTTLITMDGMTPQQPAPEPRKSEPPKTWQN